ncbi:class I SAM-dependent methyltransferase [Paenibacillus rigui]|uniref:SAM-dependent methyltransferase n=1 Tax=Paenibacillus rigui TaxID=554312 RepID=A0A229UQ63_9BACL|nr:class I SAM-dependent methyltransferase [Paenibacillus rigui]OXM85568.1 SAM-dependent methyltransferase [Paenibacillus rigui]
MLNSQEAIRAYKEGRTDIVHSFRWLDYIVSAEERIVNLEHVKSLKELAQSNPVLDYVERSLQRLDSLKLSFWIREVLEEVLSWSEAAKGGTLRQRLAWQEQGIHLMAHNIGSAELYLRDADLKGKAAAAPKERHRVIHTLIATHGLVGQTIRGEVSLSEHEPLVRLVEEGLVTGTELRQLLMPLNECIIAAVSGELWEQLRQEAEQVIDRIVQGDLTSPMPLKERLRRLRTTSIERGESFENAYARLQEQHPAILDALQVMNHATLWYVEAALSEFSFEQFIQIIGLAVIGAQAGNASAEHISFERLMNTMYYDYKGQKKMNVYKKRMIEAYLNELTFDQLLRKQWPANTHLTCRVEASGSQVRTVYVDFVFSPAAQKLIEFCVEAEKSPLYEKAVLMLYDLFGLRRDAYDRFHNEEEYLATMNQTSDYKQVILDYVVGDQVVDIGPGGGVLLDLMEERLPDKHAIGIDISQNVIEALERKKQLEQRRWTVLKGDALQLKTYVEAGRIGTVIFSSILHELYSYIEYEGSRFNHKTVAAALRSAFDVLSSGGRIIIRDGIMSEPAEQRRRIRFKEPDGMAWLERYAQDFAGRRIQFERLGPNEAMLPINDAMEFLFTYTWGEQAYVHEVQEQFGYFTPTEFHSFIQETLGADAQIIESRHYLQDGYTEALSSRIDFMDDRSNPASLPDSTCFLVIEKL